MSSTVIYFHGYGSSPNSDKAIALRSNFSVFAPSIPLDFDEARESLLMQITKWHLEEVNLNQTIFCGTSLGGYWAFLMSSIFNVPAVLINPSTNPASTLKRYNPNLTSEQLLKYKKLEPTLDGVSRIVLLAKDDEALDYRIAENLFKDYADIRIHETGKHRFNQINIITNCINDISQAEFT